MQAGCCLHQAHQEKARERPLKEGREFPKEGRSKQRSLHVQRCGVSCHLPHLGDLDDCVMLRLRFGLELERPGVGSHQATEGPWLSVEAIRVICRRNLVPPLVVPEDPRAGWSQSPGRAEPPCDPSQVDKWKGVE